MLDLVGRARRRCWLILQLVAIVSPLAGCAGSAGLISETPSGGVVTYPITNESDILSSSGRKEAMTLMKKKCGNSSRILHEGEIARIRGDIDRTWQGQLSGERLWGVEFRCN
ncbi:MAG: hypothetical protein C4293_04290 [Nitrospiraceae bacterium]